MGSSPTASAMMKVTFKNGIEEVVYNNIWVVSVNGNEIRLDGVSVARLIPDSDCWELLRKRGSCCEVSITDMDVHDGSDPAG